MAAGLADQLATCAGPSVVPVGDPIPGSKITALRGDGLGDTGRVEEVPSAQPAWSLGHFAGRVNPDHDRRERISAARPEKGVPIKRRRCGVSASNLLRPYQVSMTCPVARDLL